MDIRQHIIETAYQCFYQQGFHASGVETLARQAGTTKRTLCMPISAVKTA